MAKKIVPGKTDVLTLVPEIANWFAADLNPGVDLSQVGPGSDMRVVWRCPTCGQPKETAVNTRVKKKNGVYSVAPCRQCSYAAMRTAPTIAATPKLLRFWDFEKNKDYDANLTSVTLKDKVWWRCKNCGYEWQATPHSRMYSTADSCPCCDAGVAVKSGLNDVLTRFPEIAQTFNQELNPGIDLSRLAPASTEKVTWTCNNCGNEWNGTIRDRFRRTNGQYVLIGCPQCDNKSKRAQSYAEEFPELADMFDEKKNGRTLASVRSKERTSVKFWWNCNQCGRPFEAFLVAVINGRETSSKGCPYCAGRRLTGGDSFAELHPELMDEWDPENDIDPYKVFPNTDKTVKWICRDNPDHRWEATVAVRHNGFGLCPYCNKIHIISGYNSFADIYPELAQRWSKKNELPPEKVFYDGRVWTQWDCPDCGGTFGAYTDDMVAGNVTCPYCNDRLPLAGYNTLADTHPEIIELWSKKNARPPSSYLPNTNVFVYLTCPDCGNDYGAGIQSIVTGEADCPYCNDRLVAPGFNSFFVRHPDLMREWVYVNNYVLADPDQVSERSSISVWWQCPNDSKHHYTTSIANRVMFKTRHREPCPFCRGLRRKKRHYV